MWERGQWEVEDVGQRRDSSLRLAKTPPPGRHRPLTPDARNIVATVNLECRLDLKTIALHARNAEYNPKVGSGVFGIGLC